MNDRVVMTGRPFLVWGGFAFVCAYLLGLTLTTWNAIPSADQSLSALTAFYDDSGSRVPLLVGGLLLAVSAGSLLVFVVALTAEVGGVEASIARAGAALFASCLGAGAVALSLVAGELTFRKVRQPGPEIERWLAEFGYAVILVPGMVGAALSLCCLGRSCVPRLGVFVGGAAYVAAGISLLAFPVAIATGTLLWSQLPFILWVLWVSVSNARARSVVGSPSD